MTTQDFSREYDLSSQKKIKFRNIKLAVAPRYLPLYAHNNYEKYSLDLLLRYFQDGQTFVDIGAHYGIYSLLVAQNFSRAQVLAVEPLPQNYQVLTQNISLNHLNSQIKTKNLAVSDQKSTQDFFVTQASDSAGFYHHPFAKIIDTIQVKTSTLDQLLKNVNKVDWIKIDTEGHELQVLAGCQKTFGRNPHLKLIIELNPASQREAGHHPRQLLERLHTLGFAIFLVDDYRRFLYRLDPPFTNWSRFFRQLSYANLWCVPQSEAMYVTFFSHTSDLGGAEQALVGMVDHLQQHQVLCNVVLPEAGPLVQTLHDRAVSTIRADLHWVADHGRISWLQTIKRQLFSLRNLSRILWDVKKLNPHLIMTNTSVIPWGVLTAATLFKPHGWHITELGQIDHNLTWQFPRRIYLKYLARYSQAIWATSQSVAQEIRQLIQHPQITPIYPQVSLNLKGWPKFKSPFQIKNSFKLINASTLNQSKGQLDLVKAVKVLIDKKHKVELVLIGRHQDQEYLRQIKNYIARHHLQTHVHLVGYVSNPHQFIQSADCLVLTSRFEAFGMVILEAMKLKKVVVASRQGEAEIMIRDGQNGLLYQVGQVDNLVEKLEKLLTSPQFYSRLQHQTQKHLPEITNKYSLDKFYSQLKDLRDTQYNRWGLTWLVGQALLFYSISYRVWHKIRSRF